VAWAPNIDLLRPDWVGDTAWLKASHSIAAQFGTTEGSFVATLEALSNQLVASLAFDERAAPVAALSHAIDVALDFGAIESRSQSGSMGQGWSSIADLRLEISGTHATIHGASAMAALGSLSVEETATYTISQMADRSMSIDGTANTNGEFGPLRFERQFDGSFSALTGGEGRLEKTASGYTLSLENGSKAEFGSDGQFLKFIDFDGQETVAAYDANGQMISLSGPQSNSLAFSWDGNGRIISVSEDEGLTISFGYDANGRLQSAAQPSGTASFTYDADGYLQTATGPGGIQQVLSYDAFGRLTSVDYGNGLVTETFTYGALGEVTRTDGQGRETSVTYLPGGILGEATDGNGDTTSITFDPAANTVTLTGPDGTQATIEYDASDRVTSITDANGATVAFSYVGDDTRPSAFTDANGNARAFTYDADGRITNAEWADNTSLAFSYDAFSNLISSTNRRGDEITYTYDANGRLLSESDGSSGAVSYTYTNDGRLATATDDRGTTTITYNAAGQVTQIVYPDGKSLAYTYTVAGLRETMTDQSGDKLTYGYDALGRLTSLSDDGGTIVTYEYDGAGNLVKETNGNGTVSTFTYDAANQLTDIVNAQSDGTVNSFYSYTYDSAGQRVEMRTHDGDWTYGYDAAGQLTSAVFASSNAAIADTTITYDYDAAGNRTRVVRDGVEELYTTNALNQYTQVGTATFTYDADGNMVSRTDGGQTTTYAYDINNRLTEVVEPDGTTHTYEYDVFGNRVATVSDGVRTEFLVDLFGYGNVVADYAADGTRLAEYTHGLGLVRMANNTGFKGYFDADGVGSVAGVTERNGVVANSYAYSPFGQEIYEVEWVDNRFEFSGFFGSTEDLDGSQFVRARNYDPATGRFMQEDPKWYDGDSLNLYRFALNDPNGYTDISGENWIGLISGGIGVVYVTKRVLERELKKKEDLEENSMIDEDGNIDIERYIEQRNRSHDGVSDFADDVIDEATSVGVGKVRKLLPKKIKDPADKAAAANKATKLIDDPKEKSGDIQGVEGKVEDGENNSSPLILDLDGDGIELSPLENSNVFWDIDVDGFREQVGWVDPDDGLLAIDLNGNGRIDDHSELFGTDTIDGFTILSAYDTDLDGVITAADAQFNDLLVWRDLDQDGISDAGELQSLDDLSIATIDLNATSVSQTNEGHDVTDISTYTLADGTERAIHDVWFNFDNVNSIFVPDYDFDPIAFFLPQARGYGALPDLTFSLMRGSPGSNALVPLVYDFTENTLADLMSDPAGTAQDIRNILFTWSGVDGVDPTSRGIYIDARELVFLETLLDQPYLQRGWSPDPFYYAALDLQEAFKIAFDAYAARLILQTVGTELFEDGVIYDATTDSFSGGQVLDADTLAEVAAIAASAPDAVAAWGVLVGALEFGFGLTNLPETVLNQLDAAITSSLVDIDLDQVAATLAWQSQEGASFFGNSDPETITGGIGDDTINAGNGNDTLEGGLGADWLRAGAGDDVLDGQLGPDLGNGDLGNDTYIYNIGGGIDTYEERSRGTGNDADKILFGPGITLADLTIERVSNTDLRISFDPGVNTGAIIIENQFNGSGHIEFLEFEDGSTYRLDDKSYEFRGTPNNDSLVGIRFGGLPEDSIFGGDGDDTIKATGTNPFEFDANFLAGEAGNDRLTGSRGNDTIDGGSGDDLIDGDSGLDDLRGGPGNDTVDGHWDDDVFHFDYGDGDDVYEEGGGIDTIVFGPGITVPMIEMTRLPDSQLQILIDGGTGGSIVVDTQFDQNGGIETLAFADGSTIDLAATVFTTQGTVGDDRIFGIRFGGSSEDIIFGGDGNDTIRASGANQQDFGPNQVFGEAGNDELDGGRGNDTIDGGPGDDLIDGDSGLDDLRGGPGNDTVDGHWDDDVFHFDYGDGDDVYEEGGGIDTIVFGPGITVPMIEMTRLPDSQLQILIDGGTGGSIVVDTQFDQNGGIETLAFADGSTIDLAATVFTTQGTVGDDRIFGIRFGGSSEDIIFGGDGNDTIRASGANQQDFGPNQVFGEAGNDELDGGRGNDTIDGGPGDDLIDGDSGLDDLRGGPGNDTVDGHWDDDVFHFDYGDGDDVYEEGGGIDTIVFGPGITVPMIEMTRLPDSQLQILIDGGTGGSIVVDTQFDQNGGIETLAFADGSTIDLAATVFTTQGTVGDDRIFGIRFGGSSEDIIFGGDGNDTIRASGANQQDFGPNQVFGEAGNDELDGGRGNDTIDGGPGDDLIDGGTGSDFLYGGSGRDTLEGWRDTDALFGGEDADELYGDDGDDGLDGGLGNDTLEGGDGVDWLFGREDADVLRGGAQTDALFGNEGDDLLQGGNGDDGLDGGTGNDTLEGGAGVDWLYGGENDDRLFGASEAVDSAETDALFGEGGNDFLNGGGGDDGLDGGAGNDTLEGGAGVDWLYGSFGDDVLFGATELVDSDDTDALFGQEGNDTLNGGGGGDNLDGGSGDDELNGGAGNDWLFGQGDNDVLNGGDGLDVLFGNDGNDTLDGGADGDALDGGAGLDMLMGGAGVDILFGGTGADEFVFGAPGEGEDLIRDFVTGEDRIVLDAAAFGIATGNLSGQGVWQTGAGLPGDFGGGGPVLYFDTVFNALFHDPDGGTSGNATALFALETGVLAEGDVWGA
jgi:RHS repeat-associated protein